jgi:NAD(P)-dependent dehydrogenase (short-subunit alcohol dehydrogenase family)
MSSEGYAINLSGRNALVTGAGQHTGREFALGLAAAGASVIVNDVVDAKAQAVCEEIRERGGSANPLVFDITDLEATREAIAASKPDIVVNNVGGTDAIQFPFVHFDQTDPSTWSRSVDLNLYGVLNITHSALPHMRDQGWGRFITIISDAARRGERGMAVYAAAKAAAAGFMRSIAAEYGFEGITSNAIAFGSIAYDQHEAPPENALKNMLRTYAVKRRGRPSDPVGLLLLLASDSGEWITGQTVPIDGGFTNAL